MENTLKKNWQPSLLNFLLREMIDEEKTKLRKKLTSKLCKHSLHGMNPNEFDTTKTFVQSEDEKRFYVGVTMKHGHELVIPLDKRHFNDKRMSYLGQVN